MTRSFLQQKDFYHVCQVHEDCCRRAFLAGTSLTFVANAHAAPVNTQSQAEQSYKKDRHNPTDTNGKRPAPPPVVLPGDGRT